MSESAIRAQIQDIMEGVSGIGVVHKYERYSKSIPKFLSLMTHEGKVNGWTIHRQETPSERISNPAVERYHLFAISGLYELDDEAGSEETFQALLEALVQAFHANITLNGTAVKCDPLSIDDVDTDLYGQQLFHTAALSLRVHDREYY
jgi:hypothetical protein